LILRNRQPLDLETPVTALDRWLTPNDQFFVRSHLGIPAVGPTPWVVEVAGQVDRPLNLSLDALKGFAPAAVTAVLQCAGNGRGNFLPRVPGLPWDRGAVGQAEWTGARLSDVLARAGLKTGSAHVQVLGADGPPSPKTPIYLRSIPLEKALHPDTLLATTMNGEPIPVFHGGPVRLIVPGWTGNHWMKWVRTLTVSAEEAPGTYQQSGYRMPRTPAPPDAVLKASDLVPLTYMNVKSLITWPAEGARLTGPRQEVRGVAWTGEGHVTKVEVAVGVEREPTWRPATLLGAPRPWSWRQWRFTWDAPAPGRTLLRARATDSLGETQPEVTPWNRSGYLWNGIDRVTIEVG
jgi:DMSO/TMAO reductase YedYZ molybdopterin-dependent catalytic subunit